MKKILLTLTTIAIASFPFVANAALYVGFSSRGGVQLTFAPSTPVSPGETTTATASYFWRDVNRGTINPCGYQSVSAGASAEGFLAFMIPGLIPLVPTVTLPVFDGTCTGGQLVPKTQGATVPTSHYIDPSGRLFVSMPSTAEYIRVSVKNQQRNIKADACGNFRLNLPPAKEGRPPFASIGIVPLTVQVAGQSYDISMQMPLIDSICSQRWAFTPSGLQRVPRFLVQQ